MLSSSVTLYVIITYFPHYQKGKSANADPPSSPGAFSEIILMNPFLLLQNILLSSSLPYLTAGILQSGSESPSVR